MDKRKDIVKKLREFKRNLNNDIKIYKIIFFGSRAHGRPKKDSDVDLIIVSKKFMGKRFRYRPLGFYKYWSLDYPVDFLCCTPEEFNRLKKQATIIREAVEKGIEIK